MIDDIKEALEGIAQLDREGQGMSDAQWTIEIHTRLGHVGKARGYNVCSSGGKTPSDWNEFNYDHCWLKYDADKFLNHVALVLECEWTSAQIDEDFQKLLISNALLRVMIFQQTTKDQVQERFREMEEGVRRFDGMRNQQMLLCGWHTRPEKKLCFKLLNG